MVKNTLKLATIVFLLIIPLGTPEDFIMVPAIIAAIGLEAYIALTTILAIYLYHSTQGRTLSDKIKTVKKEIKQLF